MLKSTFLITLKCVLIVNSSCNVLYDCRIPLLFRASRWFLGFLFPFSPVWTSLVFPDHSEQTNDSNTEHLKTSLYDSEFRSYCY